MLYHNSSFYLIPRNGVPENTQQIGIAIVLRNSEFTISDQINF